MLVLNNNYNHGEENYEISGAKQGWVVNVKFSLICLRKKWGRLGEKRFFEETNTLSSRLFRN
jgi:hypothetical protein